MGHDQLFKEFLRAFLGSFLELFYPDVAARLDFATTHFLDKELFADRPDGPKREADVVARVETLDGEPEMVLIHVEVQQRRQADVPERMLEYYMLLRLRHRLPILPMVVYLTGGRDGLTEESR